MDTAKMIVWLQQNYIFILVIIGVLYLGMTLGAKSSRVGVAGEGPPRPILQNVIDQAVYFGQILGFLMWSFYYITMIDPTKFGWPIQGVVWAICGLLGFLHPLALPMLISWITPRDPMESVLLDESKRMHWYSVQKWTTWVMAIVSFFMLLWWVSTVLKIDNFLNALFLATMFTILTSLIPSFAWIHSGTDNWKWHFERMRESEMMRAMHATDLIKIKADFYMASAKLAGKALHDVTKDRSDTFQFVEAVFDQMNVGLAGINMVLSSLITANAHAMDEENEALRVNGMKVTLKLLDLQDVVEKKMPIHVEKQTRTGIVVTK